MRFRPLLALVLALCLTLVTACSGGAKALDRSTITYDDIVNTGKGPMAGAITAALFLDDFVPEGLDWVHIDLFAWNDSARPGRPVGGEAQTVRTLLAYLETRFGAG